jgi:hypothetical protein
MGSSELLMGTLEAGSSVSPDGKDVVGLLLVSSGEYGANTEVGSGLGVAASHAAVIARNAGGRGTIVVTDRFAVPTG